MYLSSTLTGSCRWSDVSMSFMRTRNALADEKGCKGCEIADATTDPNLLRLNLPKARYLHHCTPGNPVYLGQAGVARLLARRAHDSTTCRAHEWQSSSQTVDGDTAMDLCVHEGMRQHVQSRRTSTRVFEIHFFAVRHNMGSTQTTIPALRDRHGFSQSTCNKKSHCSTCTTPETQRNLASIDQPGKSIVAAR